ncbi:hypothetical protein [Phenylobacterium sp.]|uniref:hypothetical protein n=1 Tax=Phenylobacterium sp. TaxID=1871053 RepID=UPI00356568A2
MRAALLLILLVATSLAGAAEAAARWTRHVTTAGYTVDRPPGWATVEAPSDRLDIVSGRCGPQAGAICDGQAEISVRAEPFAGKLTRAKACWNLTETVSETDEGPGRRGQISQLTCTIGARRFFIVERHWKGDKHAAAYGRVALRMAKSLRYPG